MRIVEPEQIKRRSIKRKKRSKKPLLLVIIAAALAIFIWFRIQPEKIQNVPIKTATTISKKNIDTVRTSMGTFTNDEFIAFYSSFAYPNTNEIVTPPRITDNPEADKRIQSLAEARGYKLRSAPIVAPIMVEDGYYLQQKAVQPLLDMKAAAKKEGLTLTLTAGFRSTDVQRELFVSRLNASLSAIAAGSADASVNDTLDVTAPPGYSRHHNGFTVDFACGNVGLLAFLNTSCYKWLSDNNFERAKEFGWIPSYPQGSAAVGPEPEPWEYVWVGRDSLLK